MITTKVRKLRVLYANVLVQKCAPLKQSFRTGTSTSHSPVNNKHPGRIPRYKKLEKPERRKFHGVVLYAHTRWNGLIKRVQSRDKDKNLEWIHIRIETIPALNIFGTYLDCNLAVAKADKIWGQIRKKFMKKCS